MRRSVALVAVFSLFSTAAAVPAAMADESATSTVNSVGYFAPDGTRGTVNLTDSGAAAKVPGGDSPLVVSLGDSYISGEAGRWAGNVLEQQNYAWADALGFDAYDDGKGGENIDGCHRSKSAEVNFAAPGTTSINIACSGAKTKSELGTNWTPGIDYAQQQVPGAGTGYGQALLLKNLVTANPGRVRMVVLSIGGNDFGFGPIMAACVQAFLTFGTPCSKQAAVTDRIGDSAMATQQRAIAAAIDRIFEAVGENAGQKWTLLIQNYPSPLATSSTVRYPENIMRWKLGGCAVYNKDLDWANSVALRNIATTIKQAAQQSRTAHPGARIELLDLQDALNGHRLCERNVWPVDQPWGPVDDWRQPGAVDSAEWIQSIRILGRFATEAAIWPFRTQESLHPNYWAQMAYQNCLSQAYGDGSSIVGGTCVISGPGLDSKRRPKMALQTKAAAGTGGPVRALTADRERPRQVKVSWKKPRKAAQGMRYQYRLAVGKKAFSGWIDTGTARSVMIATTTRHTYTVKVRAIGGPVSKKLVFTGRGKPFSVR